MSLAVPHRRPRRGAATLATIAALVIAMLGAAAPATAVASPVVVEWPDGDLPAVKRAPNQWFLGTDQQGGVAGETFTFGRATDANLMCDTNGDGVRTPVVIRRSGTQLQWFLLGANAADAEVRSFTYGSSAAATPLCGDWNGDDVETVGVANAVDQGLRFSLRNANSAGNPSITPFVYGRAADRPVVGDWNGDGRTTIGAVRPVGNNLYWFLRNANSAGWASQNDFLYGRVADREVTGDWNGDGSTSVGVVRDNRWLLRYTTTAGNADRTFSFGRADDEVMVWRPQVHAVSLDTRVLTDTGTSAAGTRDTVTQGDVWRLIFNRPMAQVVNGDTFQVRDADGEWLNVVCNGPAGPRPANSNADCRFNDATVRIGDRRYRAGRVLEVQITGSGLPSNTIAGGSGRIEYPAVITAQDGFTLAGFGGQSWDLTRSLDVAVYVRDDTFPTDARPYLTAAVADPGADTLTLTYSRPLACPSVTLFNGSEVRGQFSYSGATPTTPGFGGFGCDGPRGVITLSFGAVGNATGAFTYTPAGNAALRVRDPQGNEAEAIASPGITLPHSTP